MLPAGGTGHQGLDPLAPPPLPSPRSEAGSQNGGGRGAGVVLWDVLLSSARQDVPKAVCQAGLPVAQGTQPQCWPWGQVRGWHRALHPTHSPLGHRFLLPPVSAMLLPSHDKPSDPSPSTCT